MRNMKKAGFLVGLLAITMAIALVAAPSGAQEIDDLDCGDPGTFLNMPVPPGDPDNLDGDDDGIGCEDPSAFGDVGGVATTTPPTVPPVSQAPPADPVEREPIFTG